MVEQFIVNNVFNSMQQSVSIKAIKFEVLPIGITNECKQILKLNLYI